jgi:hypothetical protein
MVHPGFPNGAATGLLVKDYRGKEANQEVWKFDSALEARPADDLKQAAIEEGQRCEKREVQAAGAASGRRASTTPSLAARRPPKVSPWGACSWPASEAGWLTSMAGQHTHPESLPINRG